MLCVGFAGLGVLAGLSIAASALPPVIAAPLALLAACYGLRLARLTRSGRRLTDLSGLIPRESYGSVAAGRPAEEWLAEDLGDDLVRALRLLEDEWNAFA